MKDQTTPGELTDESNEQERKKGLKSLTRANKIMLIAGMRTIFGVQESGAGIDVTDILREKWNRTFWKKF